MRTRPSTRLATSLAVVVAAVLALATGASAAPTHAWTRQFGTSSSDRAQDIAVDPAGNVLVVGYTDGSLSAGSSKGGIDAFVRKYRPNGAIAWTRQFGTAFGDFAFGVAVDRDCNILVAGGTHGSLTGLPSRGGEDAYLRKYRPDGSIAWTRQFGSTANDGAVAVAVDAHGNAIVTGGTHDSITGLPSKGGADAFVRKYRPNGAKVWTRQFGSAAGDFAQSVSVDGAGEAYVAGYTYGSITGPSPIGGYDAFVRKYRRDGAHAWTRQFGSTEDDHAFGVAVDPFGNAYVAGLTAGSISGAPSRGGDDAFVRKYRPNGVKVWTRQLGTVGDDVAHAVTTDAAGRIYVAGQTGTTADAFVRQLRPGGATVWLRLFGSAGTDEEASAVGLDPRGNICVGGITTGAFAGQTSKGMLDAFVRKYRR